MLIIAWKVRPGAVLGFFVGAVLEVGGTILAIYATARLGAQVAGFVVGRAAPDIWLWLWVDVAASAVIALGFYLMSYNKRILYFAFVRWSTTVYLTALCRLDLADYYDKIVRNRINKVSGAYTWQMSNLAESTLDLIYGIMRFLAITVVVSQITWWIVPLVAIFLIPTLLAESRLAGLQWFIWDAKGDQRHIFWGLDWILRQAKGQMELRSLQAAPYILNKIDAMNEDFYAEQQRTYRRANRWVLPSKFMEIAGTAIGSIVVLRQLLSHTISLDRYFFLTGALLRIGGALNNIFDSEPKILDKPSARELSQDTVPDIQFDNVSFSYPGQDKPVFQNLNLHIQRGEHVALVGENGAGKSTLIKLLLRFYRPTSGRILINGHDLQDVSLDSWYGLLATLFQDFNQYPLPVKENIQIGRSSQKPDQKNLAQSAEFAGVDTMVAGYEYGWETVLDSSFKKGIEPSGGQWQRIAIARAFYRQAKVLILDEPTSAIDAQAEYHIFNSIFDHYQGKTALIVSHRFSTVRRADRIIVINEGAIVEEGTHEQLIDARGSYYDLFTKQAEGYK
jgi:ATP-binding cassette subfamily B protein